MAQPNLPRSLRNTFTAVTVNTDFGHPVVDPNVRWWMAVDEYDAHEYNGVRRMFGFLKLSRGDHCFSKITHHPHTADQANRFPEYIYVVSYHGVGWVPRALLTDSMPPRHPTVRYTAHVLEQANSRMPDAVIHGDRNNSTHLQHALGYALGSPRTVVSATWDLKYKPPPPRLWHEHPTYGTVVTDQWQHGPTLPGGEQPVTCLSYLAPDMKATKNRLRQPGIMDKELEGQVLPWPQTSFSSSSMDRF